MNYTFSDDGTALEYRNGLPSGEEMLYRAQEIRHERTGWHAQVAICFDKKILAYDTFNIGRSEDRGRLGKTAHAMLGPVYADAYPMEHLRHTLDLFCLGIGRAWEGRFDIEAISGTDAPPTVGFCLYPYIVEGGGSILFAPPGKLKSYTSMLMSQSLTHGVNLLWKVPQEGLKTLYINLERPPKTMAWRVAGVNRALGLAVETPMYFLHAKGKSLLDIARRVRQAVREEGFQIGFLDSISRAGGGSLVEDETANRIIDMLHGCLPTWLAIGHTPRADETHSFGSIHFEAGEDVGIKLNSQATGGLMGVSLQVVKANDFAKPPMELLQYEFGEGGQGLMRVTKAKKDEWPELVAGRQLTPLEKLTDYIQRHGPSTCSDLAAGTDQQIGHVNERLRQSGWFVELPRDTAERMGKQVNRNQKYWALAERRVPGTPL